MVDFSGLANIAGSAFLDWLRLFAAPLKNLDMLWIIVPIWGAWFFAEFFQEKKGTSFGNAIANGVVMLFVGIDWVRYAIGRASADGSFFVGEVVVKMAIAGMVLILGFLIIAMGIRANPLVRVIGRVREVSYLMLVFTPIVYGVVDFNLRTFIIIIAFLPLFYLLVELIDRITPTPKASEIEEEEAELKKSSGMGIEMNPPPGPVGGGYFGQDIFSQFPPQPRQPGQGNFPQQQWPQQGYPGYPGNRQQRRM